MSRNRRRIGIRPQCGSDAFVNRFQAIQTLQYSMAFMKKCAIAGLVLVACLSALAYWRYGRQTTLVNLQTQFLFAKSAADKANVIARLQEHYLNQKIPESVLRRVDSAATALLRGANGPKPEVERNDEGNIYKLESRLQRLLEQAMVARARDEVAITHELLDQACSLSARLDSSNLTNYWSDFVGEARNLNKEQAFLWLKAKAAEKLCNESHRQESRSKEAELYAATGLKSLASTIADERLQLDLQQRLIYILYEYRNLYDLAIEWAHVSSRRAQAIDYQLRICGLLYQQAEALTKAGRNHEALRCYDAVLANVNRWQARDQLNWFKIPALLGRAEVLRALGEYENALRACEAVDQQRISRIDSLRLQVLKWYTHHSMGNYETAKENLDAAFSMAQALRDTLYLIRCLNNSGATYERLSEYDRALDQYDRAYELSRAFNSDVNLRMIILGNIAEVAVIKNDGARFRNVVAGARKLLKTVISPQREARLLANLAGMHKKADEFLEAAEYFKKAAALYQSCGLLQRDLEMRVEIVRCLIALARYDEAENLLSEIAPLAERMKDSERVVDALALQAHLHSLNKRTALALATSNRLLDKIEKWSGIFDDADLLRSFRQRVHDYLKSAVLYEIAAQRVDSAFCKLEYAKGYALKHELLQNPFSGGMLNQRGSSSLDEILSEIGPGSMAVDYLLTDQKLYAFLLQQKQITLLTKDVGRSDLQKKVSDYNRHILNTESLYRRYDPQLIKAYYDTTAQISRELYEILLGWPEIKGALKNSTNLFIIPDDFLFEMPYATLLTDEEGTQNFLVDNAAITILPNAGLLHSGNALTGNAPGRGKKVLISINEQFPGAKKFAATIKTHFPLAEELSCADSTFGIGEVIKKLNEKHLVYIFIGHGKADPIYPERGYIELSVRVPSLPEKKVIRLSLADLKKISWLEAEMVMLVGCETAHGKLYSGTGIFGLHHAFMTLGAQYVLGNSWEIDADQSIMQAQNFVNAWTKHGNAALALRECQIEAIRNLKENAYYLRPSPYFWGSNVLSTTMPVFD